MFKGTISFNCRVDGDANYVAKRRRNCESVTRVVNQYIAYKGQSISMIEFSQQESAELENICKQ
jgi:hypothetical protein